ncbi:bifunctional 2-polyprenyl-6-hydroxyphenol methylase/3-demethylubiquinol 3-O-methyltransferase UbiG [Natronospira bacteriovora]|uniref:Ubiquinone biosynthesis O-methyltransferase n=1 Tax=Natronospira bacteriovora TaxID=3069753 RepID=A0ABU0W5H3_9GAMM|nr:bifunctional 2-polyprenyl-6-hydroxyphenol methylase/3-demethylubiquinol 3-O-methyltransferase UbiG [Natronospira sp. AB-CW4]MDQ2069173.1 bifunctional 2-polyprenyl-6-hydroxyphenol methylase/3-demethylubiquinol 3-O-methyltransferase UbiG [Natronospira sp. AB-CW4]
MSERTARNVDPGEIEKFEATASRWWDAEGEFRTLHEINPLRLDYIRRRCGPLSGRRVLDVGCGGGLLCEGMAADGADVTGIDLGQTALSVADLHLLESGLKVEYLRRSVEEHADERPQEYDIVTCLEMIEHVPDPASVVAACARLVKPGGQLIFSTINRTPKAWLMAIVGAEYVLGLLPRGTHEYDKFIRPSELRRWAAEVGLTHHDSTGLHYNPLTRDYHMGGNVDVNYFMHFGKTD